MNVFCSVLFLFVYFLRGNLGANILFVSAPGSASHRRSLFPLAEALARAGHSVTMFSEIIEPDNAMGKNITNKNVMLNFTVEGREETMFYLVWKQRHFTPFMMALPWWGCTMMTNELVKQLNHEYDELINTNWDIIFVDALFTPTGVVVTSLLKKPFLLFITSAIGAPDSLYRSIPFPSASTPALFLQSYDYDPRRFLERLSSTFSSLSYVVTVYAIDYILIRRHLSFLAPNVSLSNFYSEADSPFIDFPMALDYPRPLTPDVVSIGGKCKEATLQDKELLHFVEDPSSQGTIVLAFGHVVNWHTAPLEKKTEVAKALNTLKEYRFIWQYKGEPPVEMGPHVKLMDWLPQTELLNHPKTKVFVSHAGMKSIMEAVCGEVPMVLIPIFAEQTRNGFLIKRGKAGDILSKHEITAEALIGSIRKLATDPRYKLSMSKLKTAILDKPISPEGNGLFWTDFIIRHQGMPRKYFRVYGHSMNWVKYFCLDVIVVFVIVKVIIIFIILYFTKLILRYLK